MNPNLPEMVIEKRDSTTAHNVPAPDLSPENLAAQMQDAMQLNKDAAIYEIRELKYAQVDMYLASKAWTKETLDILVKHIGTVVPNVQPHEIIDAAKDVLGFSGFDQVSRWVQDDQCTEGFNKMLAYCLREGQKHKHERGFIDGSGIGYVSAYSRNLKHNIEKTFDSKYFYKVARPLQHAWEQMGVDLTRIANKVHPGHWSYPQGHSTKFFTAVQTLTEVFHTDKRCRRKLMIAACLGGHGRDGNLIHYPMDTYAAGPNTKLEEFQPE